MHFDILTIFPEVFPAYLEASILGRARQEGLVDFGIHNIRDYAADKHRTVDDTPYGGGAGMVLKIEPIAAALDSINDKILNPKAKSSPNDQTPNDKRRVVVLSARGEMFTQEKAQEYARLEQLILICGRYEGIDQRVADHLADEELSIGPYVLAGGEVAAMAVIEATVRLIPGVLGNKESLAEESNWKLEIGNWKLSPEYSQYTKPEEYRGWKVPGVLLSGDHRKIREWRKKNTFKFK